MNLPFVLASLILGLNLEEFLKVIITFWGALFVVAVFAGIIIWVNGLDKKS